MDAAIPRELVTTLRAARHVAVLTGAGISAESGLPTFREAQTGLWARYRPEDLATPQAFRRNPRLVWEWYAWRRELVARALPNAGHTALARLEQLVPRLTLITQNVDGLHQQAGSRLVIELHGNLRRAKCFAEDLVVEEWEERADPPPRCPRCGAHLRPDVVWFGEALPEAALQSAFSAAEACDLFLTIGTSGLVQPAASLPYVALKRRAVVGVINLERTMAPAGGVYFVDGSAAVSLPALLRETWPETA